MSKRDFPSYISKQNIVIAIYLVWEEYMEYYVDTSLIDEILDEKTQQEIANGAGVPQSVISGLKRNRQKYERMALVTAHKLTQYALKQNNALISLFF